MDFRPPARGRVIGAIVLYIQDNRKWVQFYGASGMRPENAVGVQAALQHAGVRHRYQASGVGGGAMGGHASAGQTIQILVHKDDLHKARQALARMDDR